MKANRLALVVVASTLALTGCAQSGSVAARVGDTAVPTSDVDFLTKVQCDILDRAAEKNLAQVTAVPVSRVRAQWVNALVEAELDRQLAAREALSYDRATLRSAMDQFEATLSQAPAGDRDRARQMIESIYRGQLEVVGYAQRQLAGQGVTEPGEDEIRQTVTKLLDDFRKDVEVEVNPEYGPDGDGVAGAVDPSLSRAVSSYAKDSRDGMSASAEPDATWVGDLPADQRCG